ncbi:MAG: aminotransferase class V-fold PLP-dependent enzyme [Desulfotomaculaceae bacterium]|nr:aminotransferase class V-fold PLP-dependent enzyme [Desulfotomaculaceae bacterium]
MIYFDNAATSYHKPEAVAEAVYQAIKRMGNSGRGTHGAMLDAARMVYDTREKLAELFHVDDCSRIAFTSNATESLNIAIKGLLKPGDHVITTELEHNSVLRPLYEMELRGIELSIIKSDFSGNIQLQQIEHQIKENTKAVICTHSSNLTGNLLDINGIGNTCKEHHILFILDASQSAGVFPIDVRAQSIDVLCFTGHKGLLGPQGTGGIYVREGISISPLKTGGSGFLTHSKIHPAKMPEHLEAGTLNVHGIAGLNAGISYILKNIEQIRMREQELMWMFYEGVRKIPGVKVYGDFSVKERAAIVTLNIKDYDSSVVSDQLVEDYEIYTRAGGHCAPLMHEALGTKEQGAVRFSLSHFNTDEEVKKGFKAIEELALD